MRRRGSWRAKSAACHSNTCAVKPTNTPIDSPTPLWTVRLGPDRGCHAARRRAVASIGTQDTRVARRAELGRKGVIRWDARSLQLIAHRTPAIEKPVIRTALAPEICHWWIAGHTLRFN